MKLKREMYASDSVIAVIDDAFSGSVAMARIALSDLRTEFETIPDDISFVGIAEPWGFNLKIENPQCK